jgi:hypothetical protein
MAIIAQWICFIAAPFLATFVVAIRPPTVFQPKGFRQSRHDQILQKWDDMKPKDRRLESLSQCPGCIASVWIQQSNIQSGVEPRLPGAVQQLWFNPGFLCRQLPVPASNNVRIR